MAFPELINQYSNRHFIAFVIVLNQLKKDEIISKYEMIDRIKNIVNENSQYSDELIENLINEAYNSDILAKEKSNIRKIHEKSVLLPMSVHEKIYLKNILKSPYALLFLDISVIEELLNKLSDVPDLSFDKFFDFVGTAEIKEFDEEYIKNFRLLMKAIHERRKINFTNINAQGQKYKNNERFPFKIEYSVTMRHFWLSLWNKKEERPFKANISRISDIEILDVISDEEYESVMNMMEQKKEKHPIVMTVTNENYAIERINLLFSMYHKNTEFISADKIKISLSYYNFDEDEIIRNIMSFGKSVHVLSPENIVNKIKEKLISE